jgi:hypothetical protein
MGSRASTSNGHLLAASPGDANIVHSNPDMQGYLTIHSLSKVGRVEQNRAGTFMQLGCGGDQCFKGHIEI